MLAGHTPEVERGIAAGLASSGARAQMTAEEQQRIERARQDMNLARSDAAKQAAAEQMRHAQLDIQGRINKSNAQMAGEMAAQLPTNAKVRDRVRGFARSAANTFPKNFASDLAALEPDRMQSDSDEADAWLEQVADWSDQGKRRRARLAKEKRDKADEKHDRHAIAQAEAAEQRELDHIADQAAKKSLHEGQQAQRELAIAQPRRPVVNDRSRTTHSR